MSMSVIEAFAEMHKNGISHHDFKPANLLFDARGNCYVSDFGSAQTQVKKGEHYNIPAIDMAYLSPEFIYTKNGNTGEERFNLDNWRLGLTLLQVSYPDINIRELKLLISETYKKINSNDPSAPEYDVFVKLVEDKINQIQSQLDDSHAPGPIKNVINGLLAVEPTKRMTSQQALEEIAKLPLVKNEVLSETFAKVLAQRRFADFIDKVKKCNEVERRVAQAGSTVSAQLQHTQM